MGHPIKAIPPGFVRFRENDEMFIVVRLGAGPGILSGGYGGWEAVKRPRENALVEWLGHEPMQMDVPIIFDGMLPDLGGEVEEEPWGDSVEGDIRILEHLTHLVDGANSPPIIRVESAALPFQDRNWVINDIKWSGDDVRRPADGERVRASAVVSCFEWIEYDIINGRLSSAARRKRKGSSKNIKTKSRKGTYIVREGDTLRKIAKNELGSAGRWHEIAKLNNIRDGSALHKGQRLKMP